nr:hypothetical protein [Tanacetum cinerariifolium]
MSFHNGGSVLSVACSGYSSILILFRKTYPETIVLAASMRVLNFPLSNIILFRAFRVFNTIRQQTKETYHITFDESPDAIKFSKPPVDNINIAETKRYPPDEYLHPYKPSQSVEDTSAQNTILIPTPPLPIPSMVTPAPQDRWSQDKHIKLVNIISNLGARILTGAMAKQLSAASAYECLFIDFLFEEEPKKVSEALKHPRDKTGIVIKNKARLVAQGDNQQEDIDYDETFAPVARLKAI